MSTLVLDQWVDSSGYENQKVVAWVYFDGTQTPVAYRAGGNVSGLIDNGTGNYTILFTNELTPYYLPCFGGYADGITNYAYDGQALGFTTPADGTQYTVRYAALGPTYIYAGQRTDVRICHLAFLKA